MSSAIFDEKKIGSVHVAEIDTRTARNGICGVRRRTFIAATLAILLCLGLGLGLGIGLHSRSSRAATTSASLVSNVATSSTSLDSSSSTSLYSNAATVTRSSTSDPSNTSITERLAVATSITSTTSSAPRSSGTASTSCPSTNGTTFNTSGHTFLILCENDIQASNKIDLGRVYQPSFNECIESCALINTGGRADISAVYWVDYNVYDTGTCWCMGGTSRAENAYPTAWAANNLAWIQS